MEDFAAVAIEFYKSYYKDSFSEEKSQYIYSRCNNKIRIQVMGDVCFNLKKKHGKFFTLFGSVIKDEKEADCLFEALNPLRYSPMNISIMPKTGGINNIKKWIGNDRFDTFAWLMSQYFSGNKVPIVNGGAINMLMGQRILLEEFLDSYKDEKEYFDDIYGIKEELTMKLVESGKNLLIREKADLYKYIGLALEYWEARMNQENIKSYIGNQSYKNYKSKIDSIKSIIGVK